MKQVYLTDLPNDPYKTFTDIQAVDFQTGEVIAKGSRHYVLYCLSYVDLNGNKAYEIIGDHTTKKEEVNA